MNGKISAAHGGGGILTEQLIREVFLSRFDSEPLNALLDSATVEAPGGAIAITTDAYVVSPPFFPGGDIGTLAVCGTVNDLSVVGAIPKYLTCSFILEEGFSIHSLETIVDSMAEAAYRAGVMIVAGDTKTVEKGKGDGVFITTSGVGFQREGIHLGPDRIKEGDAILVNGTLGEHGMAVLKAREQFDFQYNVQSDAAPLNEIIGSLLDVVPETRFMRDLTRGGLLSAVCESSREQRWCYILREDAIPVNEKVQGLCELLGFDPLTIANEGKFMAVVPAKKAESALHVLRAHPLGKDAAIVGETDTIRPGAVLMKTRYGGTRVLQQPLGEQLPRIC